jgi:hypothetical protein
MVITRFLYSLYNPKELLEPVFVNLYKLLRIKVGHRGQPLKLVIFILPLCLYFYIILQIHDITREALGACVCHDVQRTMPQTSKRKELPHPRSSVLPLTCGGLKAT